MVGLEELQRSRSHVREPISTNLDCRITCQQENQKTRKSFYSLQLAAKETQQSCFSQKGKNLNILSHMQFSVSPWTHHPWSETWWWAAGILFSGVTGKLIKTDMDTEWVKYRAIQEENLLEHANDLKLEVFLPAGQWPLTSKQTEVEWFRSTYMHVWDWPKYYIIILLHENWKIL